MPRRYCCRILFFMLLLAVAFQASAQGAKKKLLLLGQSPDDHPPKTHEYMAGMRILAKCLAAVDGLETIVVRADEPWTQGPQLIEDCDGVVIFLSEGAKWLHKDPRRLQAFEKLAARGGGFVGLHWGIGTRPAEFIERYVNLVGACHGGPDRRHKVVETDLQVANPKHPITLGIENFHLREELYYQLKFAKLPSDVHPSQEIQPILYAGIDGKREIVSWCWQRPDSGRSFGFTGLHFHEKWRLQAYRRLVSQGVLWTLDLPIPKSGLPVEIPDSELLVKEADRQSGR